MKKLIVVCAVLLVPAIGMCLPQPQNIGNVKVDSLALPIVTLAAVDALTPDTTGQLVMCSDCKFALCISTGAQSLAKGGFVVVGSTVPAATSVGSAILHCQ